MRDIEVASMSVLDIPMAGPYGMAAVSAHNVCRPLSRLGDLRVVRATSPRFADPDRRVIADKLGGSGNRGPREIGAAV